MYEPANEYQTGEVVGVWTDWAAVPGYSGFRAHNPNGRVSLAQVTDRDFVVGTTFAFIDQPTITEYRRRLVKAGTAPEVAAELVENARTMEASEERTDLASVPRFITWFEGPYGRHTLAAILHDHLIQDEPNTGALKSDTLADSFFRDMMGVAGVPLFKRWLMWAAVAARTRWYADMIRRLSLMIWGVLAVIGTSLGGLAVVGAAADLGALDRPALFLATAVLLAVLSCPLWGRQFGAGLVGAAAGLWLVPAAVFALLGLAVYGVMEWFAGSVLNRNYREPPGTIMLPAIEPPVGAEAASPGPA